MIAAGAVMLYMFQTDQLPSSAHGRRAAHHESAAARYLIYALFGVTLVLVPLTLRKVYQRWHKANSEAVILDIV